MKHALTLLLLLAACFAFAPGARAFDSARELSDACRSVEIGTSGSGRQIEIPSRKEALLCWGYMEAMQDLSVLVDQDGYRLIGSCPPEETTLLQLIQTFVTYARSHPAELQGKAAVVVIKALHDAFPCQRINVPAITEQK